MKILQAMCLPHSQIQTSDVIVVGAGAAGLTVALGLNAVNVSVLSKTTLGLGGSSYWAQGGIAAAIGADDSPQSHARDTLAAAADLAVSHRVNILTQEGPQQLQRLIQLGVGFDRDAKGRLALAREAAHDCARIAHKGDATGAELMRALLQALDIVDHVSVFEQVMALELVLDQGRVIGVLASHDNGHKIVHLAKAVVLATGGIGSIYSHTTNPLEISGDGLAMAARAGAALADLAFVQFHPTALAVTSDPMPLITEALRGVGATIVDSHGQRFLQTIDVAAELAPRDIVARVLWRRLQQGQPSFLDLRPIMDKQLESCFPTVFKLCRQQGINPITDLIPIAPAAHYHMGGVWVDNAGRSSLPGLWACGEVAATGVHGANRLASNSLLEALVFGERVAQDIAAEIKTSSSHPSPCQQSIQLLLQPSTAVNDSDSAALIEQTRQIMWQQVGLERDEQGLNAALMQFNRYQQQAGTDPKTNNALTIARLITEAAKLRTESRGSHFRSDYPACDARWKKRLLLTMAATGAIYSRTAELQ